ncbi:MAG TPA: YggS family pyridoxal phosphate-dependent enzyme [Bacteroidales bacterium]|nr:YggS family pyridoxal phosphate-dependent enzyme [Bacteroidales bacterium]HRZ49373.1 YggS family pyridoxal phosphate-dependent enzyme [Bacteroidales bacterium]
MSDIAARLKEIRETLPDHVRLVAVSKTRSVAEILEAWQAGQKVFGENKAQELTAKAPLLPQDIEWHFIGHLQRNKVRSIMPYVHMIHSIDSHRLLKEVAGEAERAGRRIKCLLQFYIASEETKFGLSEDEAAEICRDRELIHHPAVCIAGVMGMASLTDDQQVIHKEFATLRTIFRNLKEVYYSDNPEFTEISMGMSDDYPVAIAEGSSLIRLGTAVFGSRNP